ncbi:MAG TPA: zf-HC2 domain-containing protein [Acidimicrobiales bacterium]|jgi:mycothiol system anti-sigma-R factor|nr:zf-HC2 domain-containing protein [Acidimicrobiales bacterium]
MAGHDSCADGGASGVNCDEALSTLYTYLDGELTVEVRATIAAHLDRCRYCDDAAHFEAELRVVIADCARARVPAPLLERIRAVLAEEARSA